MYIFYNYLKDYFRSIQLKQFLLTTLFIAILIFLNYHSGIESSIKQIPHWYSSLIVFYFFYLFVFGAVYLMQYITEKLRRTENHSTYTFWSGSDRAARNIFLLFFFLAPFLFALKMIHWNIFFIDYSRYTIWEKYWSVVLQLPLKLLLLIIVLIAIRRYYRHENFSWGLNTKKFNPRPYLLILVCMLPLIALASTQVDFLNTYPKVKSINFFANYAYPSWLWRLIYEISYGLDFVSIELFFRGFLVIGFVRFVGIDAILPMAAFYCCIHFGKPLGECISSYFGGLALGVIAYRTKSIVGGLMVHLGIAYLMEIGGYIGLLEM